MTPPMLCPSTTMRLVAASRSFGSTARRVSARLSRSAAALASTGGAAGIIELPELIFCPDFGIAAKCVDERRKCHRSGLQTVDHEKRRFVRIVGVEQVYLRL